MERKTAPEICGLSDGAYMPVLESNHGLPSGYAILSGATDLSEVRSVLGVASGYGTDLAQPGQWHPRQDLRHSVDVATKRESS